VSVVLFCLLLNLSFSFNQSKNANERKTTTKKKGRSCVELGVSAALVFGGRAHAECAAI
jgi:hypothetical protein